MAKWNPSLHPHGEHGHWATVGSAKSGRKKVDRTEVRDTLASRAGRSAIGARGRKAGRTATAQKVNAAFEQRAAGKPLTAEQARLTERAAVKGSGSFWARARAANADRANGVVHLKTRREAHADARTVHQADHGGLHLTDRRTGVKQSFTGKAVAVRGNTPIPMKSPKKKPAARELMAAKPAAPAHRQYTASQLSLKTDAALREILTSRGTPIPKGARTRTLVNLIVGT